MTSEGSPLKTGGGLAFITFASRMSDEMTESHRHRQEYIHTVITSFHIYFTGDKVVSIKIFGSFADLICCGQQVVVCYLSGFY